MRLEQFFTKGSGTNGQGPGRVGSMVLDKANVMVELPVGHPMVSLLKQFSGVTHVGHRMVTEEEAIAEPELSPEDKRQADLDDTRSKLEEKTTSMALIRRIAGEPANSTAKKAELIHDIISALESDSEEVLERVQEAFDA